MYTFFNGVFWRDREEMLHAIAKAWKSENGGDQSARASAIACISAWNLSVDSEDFDGMSHMAKCEYSTDDLVKAFEMVGSSAPTA